MSRTAQIDVDKVAEGSYEVLIDNFTSAKTLHILMSEETYRRLSKGRSQEDLIRDSVRFLLAHEPKENILKQFDIADIKKYYSHFEQEIVL